MSDWNRTGRDDDQRRHGADDRERRDAAGDDRWRGQGSMRDRDREREQRDQESRAFSERQGGYGQSYGGPGYSSSGQGYGAGSSGGYGRSQGYGSDLRGQSYAGRYGREEGQRDFGDFGRQDPGRQDYGSRSFGQDRGLERGQGERGRGEGQRDDNRSWAERAGERVSSFFGGGDRDRRGDHRGKGPKNYTRSDERIRDDVNDRLSDDDWLDASEIEVMVTTGEVTLSGTVDNREDKRRAEDLAEQVSGVKHVQNNIRVQPQQQSGAMQAGQQAGSGGPGSNPQLSAQSRSHGGTGSQ